MRALLKKVIAWYWPRSTPFAFGSGMIARNLAYYKSVGCRTRIDGNCPHEQELFGCAECTGEDGSRRALPGR
jgi:hypothetical protein